MKKLPILLCVFLLSACAPSEVPYDKLLERNGQLRWKLAYKDEKQHGPNERYYENGQLMATFTNKDGRLHGLWEGYNENGQEKDGSPVCYKTDEKVDISKCKSL